MVPDSLERSETSVLSLVSLDDDVMKKNKDINKIPSTPVPDGAQVDMARKTNGQRLGFWDLWRSLPKPCKLFLALCVVQAFVIGSFASTELAKEGMRNVQDLVLLLVSSVMFLCIVADAFWHENAYQLLVSMASGGLNLAQLIIYSVRTLSTNCIVIIRRFLG